MSANEWRSVFRQLVAADMLRVDAEGYAAILNQTIDKMLEQQKAQE